MLRCNAADAADGAAVLWARVLAAGTRRCYHSSTNYVFAPLCHSTATNTLVVLQHAAQHSPAGLCEHEHAALLSPSAFAFFHGPADLSQPPPSDVVLCVWRNGATALVRGRVDAAVWCACDQMASPGGHWRPCSNRSKTSANQGLRMNAPAARVGLQGRRSLTSGMQTCRHACMRTCAPPAPATRISSYVRIPLCRRHACALPLLPTLPHACPCSNRA